MKTPAQKMGIKIGMRAILIDAPKETVDAMALPALDLQLQLRGEFDYIHFFTRSQSNFNTQFPKLKACLKATGKLWLSWPKSKQENTDLTLPKVIELGYNFGLVESTVVSLDNTWSAIKFTHPKPGKTYNNSFGKLPEK